MGWAEVVHGCRLLRVITRPSRLVIAVDPRHTSQMCSACGHIDRESRLDQATFRCTACGFELNADHNAAKNILTRALKG